jgi:hypothetical protein
MMSPSDAWAIRRLLAGLHVNGELEAVSPAYRRVAGHLASLPTEVRLTAWDGYLCRFPEPDAITKILTDVDPAAEPPKSEPPRPASLSDLRRIMSTAQWLWPLYLPAARIAGIAAFEGVGKTRFAMDLARRIWLRLPWPDGQPPTFPERTPTLWVCSDGQQDDLAEAAEAFGMPDEALFFNTLPDDPYGGTELDDPSPWPAWRTSSARSGPGWRSWTPSPTPPSGTCAGPTRSRS